MTEAVGRTVLITGAAQRIGRAIAMGFARRAWRVAVHYRTSEKHARTLIEELRGLGADAIALPADLAELRDVETLIPRCADTLGAPSCLINNASLYQNDELATLGAKSWQAHIDVNLRAPVLLAQSFARHRAQSGSGLIVNIIDQRVLRPSPDFFSYSASKAGLWWVTQTMAQALAPQIRVNAVAPGPVLPNIHQTQEDFQAEMRSTLLGRAPSPEEIAAAVLYLWDAPSVTGQMICVDGGQHLS